MSKNIKILMGLVDQYARAESVAYAERLFGTSKSYTQQCVDESKKARAVIESTLIANESHFTPAQSEVRAREVDPAERERTKTLARWISATMATLEIIDPDDMEDGGANLRSLLADGDALVSAVLRGAPLPVSQPMSREGVRLSDPEMKPVMDELKRRVLDEPGFALSLLQRAGIANTDGSLSEDFGGIGSGSGTGASHA